MIEQSILLERLMRAEMRIVELERRLVELAPSGGTMATLKGSIQDSNYVGRLGDVLRHGYHAQEGFKENKFCVRFGPENGSTGIDQVQKTGQIGMVLGNGGEFVSKWDHA